jgi:hypothetical protein
VLFSTEDLKEVLRALVDELLAAGEEAKIQIVGGAAVALEVGRDGVTGDIDALGASSPPVKAASQRIAKARNWPETWLNDAVNMYVSHYDTEADWRIETEEEGVVILVARPRLLLAMKLYAGRGRRDSSDIERLLDACAIASIEAAKQLFAHYYPAEIIAAPAMRELKTRFPPPPVPKARDQLSCTGD